MPLNDPRLEIHTTAWMLNVVARDARGIGTVALSGGVFQNRLLLRRLVAALRDQGFRVLLHREVPTNDGGLSLGQAVVANERVRRGIG